MLFPTHDLSIIEPNPVLPAKKKKRHDFIPIPSVMDISLHPKKKDGNKNFPQSIFVTCER